MHATDIGCDKCCLYTWSKQNKTQVTGTPKFIEESKNFLLNHICYIEMFQSSIGHAFVLEMRQKEQKNRISFI